MRLLKQEEGQFTMKVPMTVPFSRVLDRDPHPRIPFYEPVVVTSMSRIEKGVYVVFGALVTAWVWLT